MTSYYEVRSVSGSNSEPNGCNRFYHKRTQTMGIGPVLPPVTGHFNIASLSGIKYLCSDRITTRSIRQFWCLMRCYTSRFQICDPTNITWVAIQNPQSSLALGIFHCDSTNSGQIANLKSWGGWVHAMAQSTNWPCHDTTRTNIFNWRERSKNRIVGTAVRFQLSKNPTILAPIQVTIPLSQSGTGFLAVPNHDRDHGSSSNP
jgi:hypothetical protein